jgi:hypothetical protein
MRNGSSSQSTNDTNSGVVTNEIQLKDARVKIDCPQSPELLDGIDKGAIDFQAALATNSILPGDTAALAVEVLPLQTVRELRMRMMEVMPGANFTVRANVTFRGSRSGNNVGKIGVIEARAFSFPIELCQGDNCLLDCAGCPDDLGLAGVCTYESTKQYGVAGGVCGNAQDLPLIPNGCGEAG